MSAKLNTLLIDSNFSAVLINRPWFCLRNKAMPGNEFNPGTDDNTVFPANPPYSRDL